MLAVAGGVAWMGYLAFVYGLSQLAGQNYSIGDLAIPGKFTLGNPAPDPPSGPSAGSHTTTPCTAAQIAAGWVNAQGGCTKGDTSSTSGYCRDTKTGKNMGPATNGKCPKGQSYSTTQQA